MLNAWNYFLYPKYYRITGTLLELGLPSYGTFIFNSNCILWCRIVLTQMRLILGSDVVLETQILVSRRLETHFLSLGLGLGLEPQSLGLGLGLEPFKSWSWSRLGPKSWVQDQYTIRIVVQLNRVKNDLFSGRFLMRQSCAVANIRHRGLLRQSVRWRWPQRLQTRCCPLPRRPLGTRLGCWRGMLNIMKQFVHCWIKCSAFLRHLHQ